MDSSHVMYNNLCLYGNTSAILFAFYRDFDISILCKNFKGNNNGYCVFYVIGKGQVLYISFCILKA